MYYLSYFYQGLEKLSSFADLNTAKMEMYRVMGKAGVKEPRLYYGNAQGTQGTAVVFCVSPDEAWLLAATEKERKMGTPLKVKRAGGIGHETLRGPEV